MEFEKDDVVLFVAIVVSETGEVRWVVSVAAVDDDKLGELCTTRTGAAG